MNTVVARNKVPHHKLVSFAQFVVLLPAQNTVRWTKQVAVYEGIGLVHVFDILFCACEQSFKVVKCVVAKPMAALDNLHILLWKFMHVVAHHKEGCLYVVSLQQLHHPGGDDRYGPVVEGEIYSLFIGVHSPQSLWI